MRVNQKAISALALALGISLVATVSAKTYKMTTDIPENPSVFGKGVLLLPFPLF